MSTNRNEIVSSDDESLILVNSEDQVLGYLNKAASHDGEGILHRAFSLFMFNRQGELLIQQRSGSKRLWPLFWSNSCCSHPRKNEDMDTAIQRRVSEELGACLPFQFLYKFEYEATYSEQNQELGSERELCRVYIGVNDSSLAINRSEIQAWKWISPDQLSQSLEQNADLYTPWLKLEWRHLMGNYRHQIKQLIAPTLPQNTTPETKRP